MCDIRPRVSDVSASLCQDALMIVAVEEGVLDVSLPPVLRPRGGRDPIRLQTRLLEYDIQPPLRRRRARASDVRLDGEH